MKRSNKLLIGLLSLVIGIILLHYAALWVMKTFDINGEKELLGDRVSFKEVKDSNIKVLDVRFFENVEVLMSDSFACHISINQDGKAQYRQLILADTLFLNGRNLRFDTFFVKGSEKKKIQRIDTTVFSYAPGLLIYVTGKEQLNFVNSSVMAKVSPTPLEVKINLDGSKFYTAYYDTLAIKRIELNAENGSDIDLNNKATLIEELDVTFQDFGTFSGSAYAASGTIRYNDSTEFQNGVFGYLLRNIKLVHQPFNTGAVRNVQEQEKEYGP
jgi:hypothetical protein